MDPWIASYGNHVYVVWSESSSEGGTNSIMYKHSSDNGANFPDEATQIESGKDSMTVPKLASDENGHVYATWIQSNSMYVDNSVQYSYSTNHGNDESWSTPSAIDETTEGVVSISLSSERQAGVNHVYASWGDRGGNVTFRRSTNEVTWSPSQLIDSDHTETPYVSANDDGHVFVAYTYTNQTNNLYNADIYVNISDDQGANWDGGTLITRELFDGDSEYPEMVVVGDNIYIVWQERGNRTGIENGVDSDIFYRHYDGTAWSDIAVLSDDINDAVSQYPHIGVDGQNIYVVWQEVDQSDNTDDTDNNIVVRYSSNGGTSWGPIQLVSDDANDGESWYARVGVSGSTGHVVWRDNGDIGGSGQDDDICYRRISAGVPQGSTTIISDDANDRTSLEPDIAVDGNTVLIVWQDNGDVGSSGTDYDIMFKKSTNGGTSWENTIVISQTTVSSYSPRISVGSYIYVVWEESSDPTFSRSSTGDAGTWSEQKQITDKNGFGVSIHAIDDGIVVGYEYSSTIMLTGSQDAGNNWEEPVEVTTDDSLYAYSPSVGIGTDEVHVCYEDSGNVSGNGWDYDIIHRQSVDSYPSDVELDVGDDGSIEWNHPGEFSTTETYSGSGFVNALNKALERASVSTDSYGNEMARISLRITSDTAGLIVLDNLVIEYDHDLETNDFTKQLNDYIENHQEDQDGEGNIEIPLTVTSESAGKIMLFDLYVRYDLQKSIFITSPEDDGVYTTSMDIRWTSKNFDSDDDVTISYYDGSQWHELDTVPANQESWDDWDTSEENGQLYKVKIEYVDDTNIRDETDYFMIDNFPPTTTHTYSYSGQYNDGDTVWGREVDITLKPNDKFDGGDDGSGVNFTYYRVDGGEWIEYTEVFTIDTNGHHTFDYYSVDIKDNEEDMNENDVYIDGIDPNVHSWDIPEIRYDSDGTVHISVQVTDNETGIDEEATIHNKLQYAYGKEGQPTSHQNWRDMDDRELTGGIYSGTITEDWRHRTNDTGGEGEWGTFYLYVKCTIADNVGNKNTSEVFEIVEKDIFPPNVLEVGSDVLDDNDNMYFIGSEVRLFIVSDEEDLSGDVYISGGATGNAAFEQELLADGTTYWVLWDTTDIIPKNNYVVRFTLTDSIGNEVVNSSLLVSIQDILVPELSVTSIIPDQNGVNTTNIADRIETTINISLYNSGELGVENVELTIYLDDILPGNIIAQEFVDLEAHEQKTIALTWTPQISEDSKKFDMIAIIQEMEGEKFLENNEETIEVTVSKIPDLRITSIIVQDEGGKAITKAKEGDKLLILATVENIGDVQGLITVSAYHSGTTTIDSASLVAIPAGDTKTVTLDWISASQGEHTIIVRADPGNDVIEKDETNNEASVSFSVEDSSTGGGTGSESEGMPIVIPILIAVVLIGGIGGAVYFLKIKGDEDDDWGDDDSGHDTGWDDEPAAPPSRPAPRPRPKPGTQSLKSDSPSAAKPKPQTSQKPSSASAAAGAAVAAVKIKCPKCATILSIKTAQRPVTVKCPKCETPLKIKE